MEPVAVTVRGERRWVLIHRCTRCGRLRLNETAADDNAVLLMRLAELPLSMPPIPYAPAHPYAPEPETTPSPVRDRPAARHRNRPASATNGSTPDG
jgi:RNHCP domain